MNTLKKILIGAGFIFLAANATIVIKNIFQNQDRIINPKYSEQTITQEQKNTKQIFYWEMIPLTILGATSLGYGLKKERLN